MNIETMEKLLLASPNASVPGKGATAWVCAGGPTGAAMGACAQAGAVSTGATNVAARISKAATRGLSMGKTFWRQCANDWLMACDLGRNLTNKLKFHPRQGKAQESGGRFWADGAVCLLTW